MGLVCKHTECGIYSVYGECTLPADDEERMASTVLNKTLLRINNYVIGTEIISLQNNIHKKFTTLTEYVLFL